MKTQLSSVDLLFLSRELKGLERTRFDKAYQIGRREFKLDFRGKGGAKELIVAPHFIALTSFKYETPKKPSGLAMRLRKELSGGIVESVGQHGFERIVEFGIKGKRLIIELFSKGNLILVDESGKIIALLERQEWKARKLKLGETYLYPPPTVDVPKLGKAEFIQRFKGGVEGGRDIVRFLAGDLGLGGTFAEEVCARGGVEKESTSESDAAKSYSIVSKLLKHPIDAKIVFDGDKKVDATPFGFKTYARAKTEQYPSFNEALDKYFTGLKIEETKRGAVASKESERLRAIIKKQKDSLKKLESEIEENKAAGDLIYKEFQAIESLLASTKDGKKHWIKALREAGVSDFKEKEKRFKFKDVWLSMDKSVPENANVYYEKSKKAKSRLAGATAALRESKAKLAGTEAKKERTEERIVSKFAEKKKGRHAWYDKFRWFISSDGFLVVGGKDATTNEILIKKHLEPKDLVFHSSVHGAPFFIIKNPEGKKIPKETREQTAQAGAAYSSAWKAGWGAADMYAIKPDQVSKKAQSGEYLSKGAFMIRGEREWFKGAVLEVAIGFNVDVDRGEVEVIGGPVAAVEANAKYVQKVGVGNKKSGDLAREIKAAVLRKTNKEDGQAIKKLDLGEIQKWIPAGKGMLVR